MAKIRVLGCGNAFSAVSLNQMFLIEHKGKKLVIDFGRTAPEALGRAGISVKDIDAVYVSHQHADHIGALEHLALSRYDWVNKPQKASDYKLQEAPKLFIYEGLSGPLWENSLKGGLHTMEGFTADLNTFFQVHLISQNDMSFEWEGIRFEIVQQIHVMSGTYAMPVFGLMMYGPSSGKKVYFTIDTQYFVPRQQETFYQKADLIFQDCECTPFLSNVHANYVELIGHPEANARVLSDDIRSKMWFSHYQDFVVNKQKWLSSFSQFDFYKSSNGKDEFIDFDWQKHAEDKGFLGFISVDQEFEF